MSALPARKPAPEASGTEAVRGPVPVAAPPAVSPAPRFGGGGGGGSTGAASAATRTASLGVWLLLAPLAMFFLSLVSAFLVRRGIEGGWGSFPLPQIVWFNSAILIASSVTAELARRAAPRAPVSVPARTRPGAGWLVATFALGLVFLGGQVLAWRSLQADGIGVGATPFGSYFYLMTGAHAVHLLGGLVALGIALGSFGTPGTRGARIVAGSIVYWHFLTVVWLSLVVLLATWR